jgi:hypothetical protein
MGSEIVVSGSCAGVSLAAEGLVSAQAPSANAADKRTIDRINVSSME